MCIESLIVIGICLYLMVTVYAAWIMSDGFRLDFSIPLLLVLALMWPILGFLVLCAIYEEWRLKRRRAKDGWR